MASRGRIDRAAVEGVVEQAVDSIEVLAVAHAKRVPGVSCRAWCEQYDSVRVGGRATSTEHRVAAAGCAVQCEREWRRPLVVVVRRDIENASATVVLEEHVLARRHVLGGLVRPRREAPRFDEWNATRGRTKSDSSGRKCAALDELSARHQWVVRHANRRRKSAYTLIVEP